MTFHSLPLLTPSQESTDFNTESWERPHMQLMVFLYICMLMFLIAHPELYKVKKDFSVNTFSSSRPLISFSSIGSGQLYVFPKADTLQALISIINKNLNVGQQSLKLNYLFEIRSLTGSNTATRTKALPQSLAWMGLSLSNYVSSDIKKSNQIIVFT